MARIRVDLRIGLSAQDDAFADAGAEVEILGHIDLLTVLECKTKDLANPVTVSIGDVISVLMSANG